MLKSSDLSLAKLLEATEAESGRIWAEARIEADPAGGAAATPFAGGAMVFTGVGSPGTHALGIGMDQPVTAHQFDQLELFFRSRKSACLIDLCPLAHHTVIEQVMLRGYRIIEFNNVMVRRVPAEPRLAPAADGLEFRLAAPEEERVWIDTLVCGFLGQEEPVAEFSATLRGAGRTAKCLFGMVHGEARATAAMGVRLGNVAHFFGDATLVPARGRGLQRGLIEARLALAAEAGCEWATASVLPGSASHRNYERAGFQLAYMRVNVARDFPEQ